MSDPRAFTVEEMRERLLGHMRLMADYWANLPDRSPREKCEGLAFSILVAFDGGSMNLPGMDIVMRPHPEDKQFSIDHGENWIEDGQMINDCQLHELFYKQSSKQEDLIKEALDKLDAAVQGAAIIGVPTKAILQMLSKVVVLPDEPKQDSALEVVTSIMNREGEPPKQTGGCPHCGRRHPPDGICV